MKKNFTIRQELIRTLSYKQIHFLIKHKVFSIYLKNTIKFLSLRDANHYLFYIKADSKYNELCFIRYSFSWIGTKEGCTFWYNLNELYVKNYEK